MEMPIEMAAEARLVWLSGVHKVAQGIWTASSLNIGDPETECFSNGLLIMMIMGCFFVMWYDLFCFFFWLINFHFHPLRFVGGFPCFPYSMTMYLDTAHFQTHLQNGVI